MNQTELFETVKAYASRSFTDAQLQAMQRLAESRIGRDLRTRFNLISAAIASFPGSASSVFSWIPVPADYREYDSLVATDPKIRYRLRTMAEYHEAYAETRFAPETPFCSVAAYEGLTPRLRMTFTPKPTPNSIMGLIYYAQPVPVTTAEPDGSHPINVFPDCYVHGMLMEGFRIVRDAAGVEAATAEYATAMDIANVNAEQFDDGAVIPDRVIGG